MTLFFSKEENLYVFSFWIYFPYELPEILCLNDIRMHFINFANELLLHLIICLSFTRGGWWCLELKYILGCVFITS